MGKKTATIFLMAFAVVLFSLAAFAEEGEILAKIEEIKVQIRAEAGIEVPAPSALPPREIPPDIEITVLPEDTHLRLAKELTGSAGSEKILKAFAPRLTPGSTIKIPRSLLLPPLADPRAISFKLNAPYRSVWRIVVEEMDPKNGDEAFAMTRNLQRLNGIWDPGKMVDRQVVLVPEAMLPVTFRPRPNIFVFQDYRATEFKNLKREAPAAELSQKSSKFAAKVKKNGLWQQQTIRPEVDMVVVHTTEHEGAPFDNVAKYIKKEQLANYIIGPGGDIFEVIPERFRSFGCGQSLWNGVYNVDHRAINVEIYADTAPGPHKGEISPEQYAALKSLLEDIYARRPEVHTGRVLTHKMVALNYRYEMRSRKGDPYDFDWALAGLPDNSASVDQDMALGRAVICDNKADAKKVTEGQVEARRIVRSL